MSILAKQIDMSNANINGRTINGQSPFVANKITQSQLRAIRPDGLVSDLVSGWWPGSTQGGDRQPSMYPDNNAPFVSVALKDNGEERIKGAKNYAPPPVLASFDEEGFII
jgi:hypothetical protein